MHPLNSFSQKSNGPYLYVCMYKIKIESFDFFRNLQTGLLKLYSITIKSQRKILGTFNNYFIQLTKDYTFYRMDYYN